MLEKLFKHGLSPILFALALGAGLIAVNYVIAIKAPSFDVTKNKTNTLSKQTQNLIKDINFDVTIKAFYATASQHRMSMILDKYDRLSDFIKIEMIDPLKLPQIAELYEVKYPRTIILESATTKTRINPPTSRFKPTGEREITIALYRLMTDETKTIYFSTGHGEMNIVNAKPNGLNRLKSRLEEQNYFVNTINFLEDGAVPDDCTLLIIPGPSITFLEEEAIIIKNYLDNAGSVILMVNPGKETKLEKLLTYYGLKLGDDYVYETSRKLTTQYGPTAPLCIAQDKSPITDPLENQTFMIYPRVRSVNKIFGPQGIQHSRLVSSSENSWAETDMESLRRMSTGQKPVRDENEQKGPITVGMLTEREFALPDSVETRDLNTYNVRSAFFGNAYFISNEITGGFTQNLNLFLNTVNWITRNERIIDVTPHSKTFTPVELRQSDRRTLNWLTLVILPGSLLSVGLFVWYRRR